MMFNGTVARKFKARWILKMVARTSSSTHTDCPNLKNTHLTHTSIVYTGDRRSCINQSQSI
jgi:hypothetical protein